MTNKQIFAAVEVSDHEVRLIVGEFFNTRFNIIKVERIPCAGMSYSVVSDPEAVVNAVKVAASDASKMIGAEIRKVILAMPVYKAKRYSITSVVDIDGLERKVTRQDILKALKKAEAATTIGKEFALIQSVPVKYTVNGITTRRLPIDEKCEQLTVDVDLLCADRKVSYDIVGCIERAGLTVKDIFLDMYAVGKEEAQFEQAMNRQVILLKMERTSTSLGLLRKGRLTTATVFPYGIGSIAMALTETYGIKEETAVELVKYSAPLNKPNCSDNPVHIWSEGGETRTINEQELVACIAENVEIWLAGIAKTCIPILQAGETTVMITGEGGETMGLDELLQDRLHIEVRTYIPETLGGRNAGLTACLGLFYAYQDKLPIVGDTDDSLDMDAFIKAVSYRDKKAEGSKEDTLTNKLRGLFLEGKNKVER